MDGISGVGLHVSLCVSYYRRKEKHAGPERGFSMPQEFYGSFQDNVERKGTSPFPTDEQVGQVVDYADPGYYQASEFVPYEHPAPTNYRSEERRVGNIG